MFSNLVNSSSARSFVSRSAIWSLVASNHLILLLLGSLDSLSGRIQWIMRWDDRTSNWLVCWRIVCSPVPCLLCFLGFGSPCLLCIPGFCSPLPCLLRHLLYGGFCSPIPGFCSPCNHFVLMSCPVIVLFRCLFLWGFLLCRKACTFFCSKGLVVDFAPL